MIRYLKIIFVSISISAMAQSNIRVAHNPPMGWNSFDSYGVYLHEKAAFENLDAMAKKLKPYGYNYFVIDNGWFGEYKLEPGTLYALERHASDLHINEYGLLQPSKTYFPNGLKPLIDRCHAKGLKFGLHLMRGIPRKAVELNTPIKGTSYFAQDIADKKNICSWSAYNYGVDMSKPGAQEFYNSLIAQLAQWGVDFLKVDDIVPFPLEVEAIAKAIKNSGRAIVLSLSPGDTAPKEHLPTYRKANMLRVTSDIWDTQGGINQAFSAWKKWQGEEQSGFYIDMDMIPFGQLQLMSPKREKEYSDVALSGLGNTRWSKLDNNQKYTFITLRALAASPLFVGGELSTMDEFSMQLLTNTEMIRCNQNGLMGKQTYAKEDVEVWLTPDKHNKTKGWIGIFNRSASQKSRDLGLEELGLKRGTFQLKNIWNGSDVTFDQKKKSFEIPANGVIFLTYSSM
jgi:alpha-galactosidase